MADYPYIRAYGKIMGSNEEYINREIALAKKQKAPSTAFASVWADDGTGPTGKWHTIDDLNDDAFAPNGTTVGGITKTRIVSLAL